MNSACQPIAVLMMTVSDNGATDICARAHRQVARRGGDVPVRPHIHRGAVRHARAPHDRRDAGASYGFSLPTAAANAVALATGQITVPQLVRAGIPMNLLGILLQGPS